MKKQKQTIENNLLSDKVKELIADIDRTHRYSMSRIYDLYNEAFGTSEVPQACASCLIRKVNSLKTWLDQQAKEDKKTSVSKKKTNV